MAHGFILTRYGIVLPLLGLQLPMVLAIALQKMISVFQISFAVSAIFYHKTALILSLI